MLLASPALPASSVRELIVLARARPGALTYASSGRGGPSHMAMELFRALAGLELRHIPYKGAAPAATDIMAGRVDMMFFTVSAGLPHVRSGKLKALAVAAARRLAQVPSIPTVHESGVPEFEASTWFGVALPARSPKRAIETLHGAFGAALRASEVSERLAAQGFERVGSDPEGFAAFLRAEVAKWAAAAKLAAAAAE